MDDVQRRRVGVLGGLGLAPAERLTWAGRRAMAYLAVKGPRVLRSLMSSQLWLDTPEDRARANLRRVLWQLPAGWVLVDGPDLVLLAEVDYWEACEVVDRACAGESLSPADLRLVSQDLLPGWYEDWIVHEQEMFRLRRVQALETLCKTAARIGDHSIATRAGLQAVSAEPLRESAVVALVEAHLNEGNRFQAFQRYTEYADRLATELHVKPGPELNRLVAVVQGNA